MKEFRFNIFGTLGDLEKPPRKWHDVVEPILTFFR